MQASLGQHDQYQTRTVILIEPVSMGNETARTGSRSTGGTYKELDVKLQFPCLLKKGWIESNSFFAVRFGQIVFPAHPDNA